MKYDAIPSNNSSVTEKQVVEDDILFTNPLAGKGLRVTLLLSIVYKNEINVTKVQQNRGILKEGKWGPKVKVTKSTAKSGNFDGRKKLGTPKMIVTKTSAKSANFDE